MKKTLNEDTRRKALDFKDKGNAAYENKKYELAINLYSKAILEDPSDAVFYANRGLARLKLDKFSEAVVDCSKSIELDPSYTKAYQRRATAYVNLKNWEKAKEDFQKVLSLEPDNKAALQELKKIDELSKSIPSSPPPTTATATTGSSSNITTSKPNIIPNHPVSNSSVYSQQSPMTTETTSHLRPHPLTQPQSTTAVSEVAALTKKEEIRPKLTTPTTTVAARASTSKVVSSNTKIANKDNTVAPRSGLFRPYQKLNQPVYKPQPSKPKIIQTEEEYQSILNHIEKIQPFTLPTTPPLTMYEFEKNWRNLYEKENKYNYFKLIIPDNYRNLFKTFMTSYLLMEIIDIVSDFYIRKDNDLNGAEQVLEKLSTIERFTIILLSLSQDDIQVLNNVFTQMDTFGASLKTPSLRKIYLS